MYTCGNKWTKNKKNYISNKQKARIKQRAKSFKNTQKNKIKIGKGNTRVEGEARFRLPFPGMKLKPEEYQKLLAQIGSKRHSFINPVSNEDIHSEFCKGEFKSRIHIPEMDLSRIKANKLIEKYLGEGCTKDIYHPHYFVAAFMQAWNKMAMGVKRGASITGSVGKMIDCMIGYWIEFKWDYYSKQLEYRETKRYVFFHFLENLHFRKIINSNDFFTKMFIYDYIDKFLSIKNGLIDQEIPSESQLDPDSQIKMESPVDLLQPDNELDLASFSPEPCSLAPLMDFINSKRETVINYKMDALEGECNNF